MRILQSPLNLQNVLNSDGLIRSPVRYLAPWVQLSPEPRKTMKKFMISSELFRLGDSYRPP